MADKVLMPTVEGRLLSTDFNLHVVDLLLDVSSQINDVERLATDYYICCCDDGRILLDRIDRKDCRHVDTY